jgi:hypothetical protein
MSGSIVREGCRGCGMLVKAIRGAWLAVRCSARSARSAHAVQFANPAEQRLARSLPQHSFPRRNTLTRIHNGAARRVACAGQGAPVGRAPCRQERRFPSPVDYSVARRPAARPQRACGAAVCRALPLVPYCECIHCARG